MSQARCIHDFPGGFGCDACANPVRKKKSARAAGDPHLYAKKKNDETIGKANHHRDEWGQSEDAQLRVLRSAGVTIADSALELGRSYSAVETRVRDLKVA